ncbi:Rv3235 family protein [Nakamurella deserti]|uniref:Rv3235 family protein n=1 Tax=Nakamurella deserti TaxID=2164074 RepID=UPI000DBE92CE|nr:Rv3235 family protein [Nakamurella deserti]
MTTALSTETRTSPPTATDAVPTEPVPTRPAPSPARLRAGRTTPVGAATARPLPARRMYLVPVPDSEPPFDDERPGYGPVAGSAARWTLSRSIGAPVADWTVPGWCNDADMGVSRTRSSALPDPRQTAGVLSRAILEALAGLRQLNQLSTHCSPEVFAGLKVRVRAGGSPPKLMSVRASEPTDGVAEASAVFRRGNRAAALAFRMQGIDGRWRVTELQIG